MVAIQIHSLADAGHDGSLVFPSVLPEKSIHVSDTVVQLAASIISMKQLWPLRRRLSSPKQTSICQLCQDNEAGTVCDCGREKREGQRDELFGEWGGSQGRSEVSWGRDDRSHLRMRHILLSL